MIMFIFLSSMYVYHHHQSYIFILIIIVMVYAWFLACYDYDVLVLVSFLPCTPIIVEPICKKIYHRNPFANYTKTRAMDEQSAARRGDTCRPAMYAFFAALQISGCSKHASTTRFTRAFAKCVLLRPSSRVFTHYSPLQPKRCVWAPRTSWTRFCTHHQTLSDRSSDSRITVPEEELVQPHTSGFTQDWELHLETCMIHGFIQAWDSRLHLEARMILKMF